MLEELGEQNHGASAALSTKPPRLTGGETDPEKGRHLRAHLPSHRTMSVFPQLPSLGLPQRSRGLKCCSPVLMFQKGNQGPKAASLFSPLYGPQGLPPGVKTQGLGEWPQMPLGLAERSGRGA